jgi:putative ABC transport system permease protein
MAVQPAQHVLDPPNQLFRGSIESLPDCRGVLGHGDRPRCQLVVCNIAGGVGGLVGVGTSIGIVLTIRVMRALRATSGSADIGIGNMDVYRPNIDPVALVAIAAVTAVVGVAAAFVPARRAARIDPLVALRHE